MHSKYLGLSTNGKIVQIGKDEKSSKWYYLTPEFIEKVKTLQVGEDITYAAQAITGKYHLTFLEKGSIDGPEEKSGYVPPVKAETKSEIPEKEPKPTEKPVEQKPEQKKPEPEEPRNQSYPEKKWEPKKFDSETSVKQTVMHAVGRVMIGLQGQYTKEEAVDLAGKIYEGLLKLIK